MAVTFCGAHSATSPYDPLNSIRLYNFCPCTEILRQSSQFFECPFGDAAAQHLIARSQLLRRILALDRNFALLPLPQLIETKQRDAYKHRRKVIDHSIDQQRPQQLI
jgi:hypothetical protein